MATRTHKVRVLLDDRIDILGRNATEAFPAKDLFGTVCTILALVRDKMIANGSAVQLTEYCFNVCETALRTTIQDQNRDDLNGSVRIAFEDLGRIIHEIEQTLRRGTSMPRGEYDKTKIERHKLEIQEILDTLSTQSQSLRGNNPDNDAMVYETENAPALERLTRREFSPGEFPSLMDEIFARRESEDEIRALSKDDAQAFIDVVDEELNKPDFPQSYRKRCFRALYKTCGRHSLLPETLRVPTCYDRAGYPLYWGRYADVWKGSCRDRDVAVKVIRTYSNDDFHKVVRRFCKEVVIWKTLQHPNVLPLVGVTMDEARFAMVAEWMENGNINEFVKANPYTNRFELLEGVARGLIYIHDHGVIHGDLKSSNILVDQTGCARLADFGHLTIISDIVNLLALTLDSSGLGGIARWMSPELIDPQGFGFQTSRPTKASDCYALGMIIYDTISGSTPFPDDTDFSVFIKVVKGERPDRVEGFSDSLWEMLEQCWMAQLNDRPSVQAVLRCLEVCSGFSVPPSPEIDQGMKFDPALDKPPSDLRAGLFQSSHVEPQMGKLVPPVLRDQAGEPLLPLNVDTVAVINLGRICEREHFHTEKYIFPVGYEVIRRYSSVIDPNEEALYHCSIFDGGDGPKFQIVPGDCSTGPVISGTATDACSVIVKTANQIRNMLHLDSDFGPGFFGLDQDTIRHLIQGLPRADRLKNYVRENFHEQGAW